MKKYCWSLILLLLSACTWHDSLYHQYRDIPREGWRQTDTLLFTDTLRLDSVLLKRQAGQPLRLSLSLRHRDDYPYEDLQLLVHTHIALLKADSSLAVIKQSTDRMVLRLVDDRGRWQGKGWGSTYTLVQEFGPGSPLPSSGERLAFRLQVLPLMQDSLLTGIEKVGIRLSYE